MDIGDHTHLLRLCCRLELDPSIRQRFRQSALEIQDWSTLITEAESHALSNLLYTHLLSCDIAIPAQPTILFKALTAKHQRVNRERSNALNEILDKFAQKGIETILLKGMALINCLYPDQSQRPMGDIDILVPASKTVLAQQSLREIGYHAEDRKQGHRYDHHHLPIASCSRNGMVIQVEIHRDTLSGDVTESMSFDEVICEANPITIDGRPCFTLGHHDMLKHLCHHTFEPCDRIKLGAVADIYGYATRYFDQIDWSWMKEKQPHTINTLRCLHFLSPLPVALAERLSAPTVRAPSGVGNVFPTLSSMDNRPDSFAEKIGRLVAYSLCSDWGLHIYYAVPPERSLTQVRLIRHPARMFYWIARRLWASFRSLCQQMR